MSGEQSQAIFAEGTRERARSVIWDNTDTWTYKQWREAATMLAIAVVAVSGDLMPEVSSR